MAPSILRDAAPTRGLRIGAAVAPSLPQTEPQYAAAYRLKPAYHALLARLNLA